MIRFGQGKDIDLSLAGSHLGAQYRNELLSQNKRAEGLWKRLYQDDEPGVLLADEVGKGKTYIALAVTFAYFTGKPKGRVLVLTHSGYMARVWKDRWSELKKCVNNIWKPMWDEDGWSARRYRSLDELDAESVINKLPNISFASYETLKKYSSDWHDAAYLLYALQKAEQFTGLRLHPHERRSLVKDMVECDLRSICPEKIPNKHIKRILSYLDRDKRWWKEGAYNPIFDELNHIQARLRLNQGTRFDLLIVDEAHKLEASARHNVVTRLLHKRFNKCIMVTATPFALTVHQFLRRLLDFNHARGAPKQFQDEILKLPINEFCKAVAERVDFPKKEYLEGQLRKYMVRTTWNHKRDRTYTNWPANASAESLLPTLLLERLIDGVLESGERTHIASRRESLCSSWPAASHSLAVSPMHGASRYWGRAFDAVVAGRKSYNDPKLRTAVEKILDLVKRNIKVVIFTQRLETSKALAHLLAEQTVIKKIASDMERHTNRFRYHVEKIAYWLNLDRPFANGVAKVMAHSADRPQINHRSITNWWRRHNKRLGNGEPGAWNDLKPLLGTGTRLPIVVRHDALTGPEERNVDKFNLPSSPLVLIATPKAQEGIDLHHYCRHVVLFDLTWNPAVMEQRIGRVHRLGGIRKSREKVTVIYCYQNGTYEEVMAARVQQRCEMMRVLLGAGQWLDADREVKELDKYIMHFPA